MIKGKEKVKLTPELIYSKVNPYSIYRHYLGFDIETKKKFPSPFREKGVDNNPNLGFFTKSGPNELFFKDFATDLGGDCFKFVMDLYNINFNEALRKIDTDMGLGIQNGTPLFKMNLIKNPEFTPCSESNIIQIETRSFNYEELDYWNKYHIDISELFGKVYAIHNLYINKQLIRNFNNELRFAYRFEDKYLKIYTPFSKNFKWISNVPNDVMSGFDAIKRKIFNNIQDKNLIITKSVKDEIILGKFFNDVCSTQNESHASINKENLETIFKGYRPENVIIAYDNDRAGVIAAEHYKQHYGFNPIYVNLSYGVKDWADLGKEFGINSVKHELIKTELIKM